MTFNQMNQKTLLVHTLKCPENPDDGHMELVATESDT